MPMELHITVGPDKGQIFRVFENEPLLIGRSRHAYHRLNDMKVSRVHCEVEIEDGQVHITDLDSAGGTYLNPALGARLAAEPPAPAGRPDDLTGREVDVLRLIARGHTNAEIGKLLFLSVRTVETHRAHIQQRLGRTTRAGLVQYAFENGLVEVGGSADA